MFGHVCTDYTGCPAGYPVRWCSYHGGRTPQPTDMGRQVVDADGGVDLLQQMSSDGTIMWNPASSSTSAGGSAVSGKK